jgi:hypothetical protein
MNRSYKYRWNIFRQKMELIKETPLTFINNSFQFCKYLNNKSI